MKVCVWGALFLFLGLYQSRAGAGDFQWLRTAGGSNAEVPRQIVVDDTGSSYIVGSFNSSNIVFGGKSITNTLRTAFSTWDTFVVKYDTTSAVVWALKLGGTNDDRGGGIAVDAQHNVYVTGYFESTNFYVGAMTLTNRAPSGNSSLFVAKFDSLAHLVWADSPRQSTYSSSGSRVAVDGAGNVYVAGSFRGTNDFGGTNLIGQGYSDALLLKYDSTGHVLWARRAGGEDMDGASGLALDADGNVYLLANIRSTNAVFGAFTFAVKGTNTCQNMVVAKYDPAGTVLWAKQYGGTDIDAGADIALGPKTNCYITGTFMSSNLVFGGTTLSDPKGVPYGDIFVAVLNRNGDPQSAWAVHGDWSVGSTALAVDPVGNCYITGFFLGTNLVFTSGWQNGVTLANSDTNFFAGSADAYVAKFTADGNLMRVFQPVGLNDQRAFSLAVDAKGVPYVTGWTMGTNVMFGSFAATNAYLDMFVGKLDPGYPVLRMETEASSGFAVPGMVMLSFRWDETGSAGVNVEFSTNLMTWSDATVFQTIVGMGRSYPLILKTGDRTYYRLRLTP